MTPIRKAGFLLFVLSSMLTAACTTPSSAGRTARYCRHWDVNGTWSIDQANGFFITLILRQKTKIDSKHS
jgi:hypothetical protein